MYKFKYYLRCSLPMLALLPVLAAAHFVFGEFYAVFNCAAIFLVLSSLHYLLNKRVMITNLIAADIAWAAVSVISARVLDNFSIPLYTGPKLRGILILFCVNQLFMYGRNNYKERAAARKGIC